MMARWLLGSSYLELTARLSIEDYKDQEKPGRLLAGDAEAGLKGAYAQTALPLRARGP